LSKKQPQKEIAWWVLRSGDTGSRLYLMSAGIHQALAFVKTIENKLYPRRDSKFFEDFLQIISNDSGSTALGLSVAFLSLNFWRSGQPTVPRILFPILIAALPLLDGALAIIRRLSGGLSPLYGDRLHVCDRMMARGWSQRAVALACYGITSVFVAIACWGVQRHSPQFWLVAALGAGLLTASALTLGSLRSKIEESPHQLATHEIRQVGKTSAGFD
jgi:hypothetical protein